MPDTTAPDVMRGFAPASALLWGLQSALLNPALALLLVRLFDAGAAEVGLALAVYNGSGFVASLVLPAYADRRRDYLRPMCGCAVLGVALAALLATTASLPVALAGLLVLGGPAAVGSALLFGQLKHAGATQAETVRTRAVFSAAWVVGPPVASLLIALSPRAVLLALAVIALSSAALTAAALLGRAAAAAAGPEAEGPEPHRSLSRATMAALLGAFVAMQTGNSTAVSVMSLYVTTTLGLNVLWAGVALSVAAALEVPALLLQGRLSRRCSDLTLVAAGCVTGAAYYGGMAAVAGPGMLIGLQVLNACFVASVAGAGLAMFQRVVPRPGLAAGLHQNTFRLGSVLAGPVIGVGSATALGYRATFLLCAFLTLVALAALAVVARPGPSGPAVAAPRTRAVAGEGRMAP